LKIVAPKALWSAAASCRFCLASLLASSRQHHPARGQQAGLEESGSKLPHSKALRAFSRFLGAAGAAPTRAAGRILHHKAPHYILEALI
jgi:hypothetical protein